MTAVTPGAIEEGLDARTELHMRYGVCTLRWLARLYTYTRLVRAVFLFACKCHFKQRKRDAWEANREAAANVAQRHAEARCIVFCPLQGPLAIMPSPEMLRRAHDRLRPRTLYHFPFSVLLDRRSSWRRLSS